VDLLEPKTNAGVKILEPKTNVSGKTVRRKQRCQLM
jgi:hypothetical protein